MKRLNTTSALLLLVLLTGCSNQSEDRDPTPESLEDVSIEKYSEVTAVLDFGNGQARLPLDRFSVNSPEVVTRALHAIAVRTDRCMTKRGFPEVASSVDWSEFRPIEDRRYGVWSSALAEKFGFDVDPDAGPRTVDMVRFGVDYNKALPSCTDEAKSSLKPQFDFLESPNIGFQTRSRSQDLVLASREGKAALADWRACMESQGIVLDPDDGRPSPNYKEQGKAAEVKAAVTEAGCADSSNAIQRLYDLQARYESAYLDAYGAQFASLDDKRSEMLTALDRVISGG